MMDHRRYGGLPLQPELALCQILQEARHRWLRPTEVCEILRNYRKFKLTPDPPHKPQSGSLFLFDRKALRYFRKDGHNWRKKKDGKTVREAHERLKAGSIEVLHCYYAHGEENENFQRRSYWMLDTNEHIVLVHYREVKEGNRSGMRSPSSYSTDGGSPLGNSRVIATSSPQTSPLVSPRASSPNTSTDWNGHTYSPEYDDPESSDDTDHCFQQEWDPNVSPVVSGLEGASVVNARNLQSRASFSAKNQNGVGYEEKNSALFHNICSTTPMDQRVSGVGQAQGIPSKWENDIVVPPGGFDLLEYTELLKNGKRMVGRRSFEISDKEVIDSPNWADMLAQGTMQQDQNTVDTLIMSSMIDSSRHNDLRTSISEAPGSIQAPIQPPFHPQTHSPYIADSSEMLPNLSNNFHPIHMESLKATQLTDKQDSNVTHWSGILEQLSDNTHGQSGIFGGFESDFLNDTQQPQLQFMQPYDEDGQPFSPQHEPVRFDVANSKEVFQAQSEPNVFKDFQADTPFQNEVHDAFKKLDSFGRWMNQEIAGDNEKSLTTMSSDSTCWATALDDRGTVGEVPSVVQQMQLDIGLIPLLPREQCFSITDFSPDNALSGAESKVLVSGTFNNTVKDPSEFKWCCMFGEVEVPAEVLHSGVLRCRAPPHSPGRVPFYITRNDRVPCSDVREFEYRNELKVFCKESSTETLEGGHLNKKDMLFQIRLARMLSTRSHGRSLSQTLDEARDVNTNFDPLNCYDEWEQMEDDLTDSGCLLPSVKEQFIQNLLKEKLQTWLSEKMEEEGKGASVLDDHGLGVLHMGAALGYTWTIAPILAAGVSINFRDSRGMTALHWAAHCGRETMVVALLAAGAAPGVKTDPTNSFPDGQTPADLASIERHKGIAGYLAESSLTSHLSLLTLKSSTGSISTGLPGNIAVETVSERTIVQPTGGGSEDQLSLQDSLAAVRNATQAAARIQTVFRVSSFRRKQESFQLQEDEYGISNEEVRYIVAAQKAHKSGASYGEEEVSHSAAIRIQQKFRGWKGRRDFLLFRQHVVKIQAHVRGHQVRKHYRKIVWSVGIVEKAILRWRRKGKGLRGFCADDSAKLRVTDESWESDGDDFLKAGRKQTEAGLEKALARVQSMVRSPEARDQYRRLVESYQKAMVGDVTSPNTPNSMNLEHIRCNGDFSMFITDQ